MTIETRDEDVLTVEPQGMVGYTHTKRGGGATESLAFR
jgi:hypothetical protein